MAIAQALQLIDVLILQLKPHRLTRRLSLWELACLRWR